MPQFYLSLVTPRAVTMLIAGTVMGLLVTASTYAQQMGSPLDFVNSQLAEQMKNQVRAMSDPELVKARAQLQRKYYEALIEAGFSKEEAMKIIIATAQGDAN